MTRKRRVINVVMSGLAGWEQQELSFSKVKLGWWSCIYAELAERQSEVLSETQGSSGETAGTAGCHLHSSDINTRENQRHLGLGSLRT